ncbi:MAG TPA: hypothetical protein VJM08_10415 [Anaerolineales bacterium]|nr:hypothetical protein [Anaerolineales bacterium]
MALIILDVVILFVIDYLLSYDQLTWNSFFSNLFIVGPCAFLISGFLGFGIRIKRRSGLLGFDLRSPELKEPPVLIMFNAAIAIAGLITLLVGSYAS